MSSTICIFGSARSEGDTSRLRDLVLEHGDVEIIDLNQFNISYYDYAHCNDVDDFLPIARKMAAAKTILFATPVYWYSMSAQLKTFFDRLTDLITIHKDIGRALAGKDCYLIACGSSPNLPDYFEKPVKATCDYFEMHYKGCLYGSSGANVDANELSKHAKDFAINIFE